MRTRLTERECRGKAFYPTERAVLLGEADTCETCGAAAFANSTQILPVAGLTVESLAAFIESKGAKRLAAEPGELSHDEDSGVSCCTNCPRSA